MADNLWLGRAEPTAEIYTITIGGTWVAADTVTVTIGGADLVLVVGSTVTTTAIASALKAALAGESLVGDESRNQVGSNIAQFSGITPTVSGSVVTLTGTDGIPFTMSVAKSSTSGTVSGSNTQDATGPNHVDNADNWSDGVPNAGDAVYVGLGLPALRYGLDQISGTLLSFTTSGGQNATEIGLPEVNVAGYAEYLPTYLSIDCTTVNLGVGSDGAGGASLQKIDAGSVQTTLNIYGSGQSSVPSQRAIQWKGTHASNVINQYAGELAIAQYGSEVATVATLNVFSQASACDIGSGVTLTTLNVQDATVKNNGNAFTTLTMNGGTVTVLGSAAMTTVTVHYGTFNYRSSGTITNLNVGGKGTGLVSTDGDARSKTVTNATVKRGGQIVDKGTITYTNNIAFDSDVTQISAA